MAPLSDELSRVTQALDGLATAMVSGRADAVLASEDGLAESVRALTRAATANPRVTQSERTQLVTSCLAVQAAVLRCRMLGSASATLERIVVPTPAYDAPGRAPHASALATRHSRM